LGLAFFSILVFGGWRKRSLLTFFSLSQFSPRTFLNLLNGQASARASIPAILDPRIVPPFVPFFNLSGTLQMFLQ